MFRQPHNKIEYIQSLFAGRGSSSDFEKDQRKKHRLHKYHKTTNLCLKSLFFAIMALGNINIYVLLFAGACLTICIAKTE